MSINITSFITGNVQPRILSLITLEKQFSVNERIVDHIGTETSSHQLKPLTEGGHKSVEVKDYQIVGTRYYNNTIKRK